MTITVPVSVTGHVVTARIYNYLLPPWASQVVSGEESACQCRRLKRCGFNPWVGKIPCCRKWQPASVFLHGKFCGQRSLAGYSLWDHKKSDTTEHAHACVVNTQ